MNRAKLVTGLLLIVAGLATFGLKIGIMRQANGDTYGLVFGEKTAALALLSVLVGAVVLIVPGRR
jgi:hypothetical protein